MGLLLVFRFASTRRIKWYKNFRDLLLLNEVSTIYAEYMKKFYKKNFCDFDKKILFSFSITYLVKFYSDYGVFPYIRLVKNSRI